MHLRAKEWAAQIMRLLTQVPNPCLSLEEDQESITIQDLNNKFCFKIRHPLTVFLNLKTSHRVWSHQSWTKIKQTSQTSNREINQGSSLDRASNRTEVHKPHRKKRTPTSLKTTKISWEKKNKVISFNKTINC